MRSSSCDPGHGVLLHRTCATILFPHSLIFFASFATWYQLSVAPVWWTLWTAAARMPLLRAPDILCASATARCQPGHTRGRLVPVASDLWRFGAPHPV